MARKLRIRVDHNVCVGNAMCETFAPHVFLLNANRQSEAVNPEGELRRRFWRRRKTVQSVPSSWKMPRRGNACSRRQSRGLAVLAPRRSGSENPT